MKKEYCFNLLIFFIVLGSGILVTSEGSTGGSSSFLLRLKRASPPSPTVKQDRWILARDRSLESKPEFRLLPSAHRTLEVGMYEPPRWNKPLLPGMVRLYHGNNETGIGVVAHPGTIVTKAHYFDPSMQPDEFHVEFRGEDGETVSRNIDTYRPNKYYFRNEEEPWGPNDVCMAHTLGGLIMAKAVSVPLKESRLFTKEQIEWIGSRTGCLDGPASFEL